MAGNPPEPLESAGSAPLGEPAGEHGLAPERAQASEHTGPVAIARHVKADGRALILYSHGPAERK
jgi:hypothetical protein